MQLVLKAWWQTLNQREQMLVGIGALFLAIFIWFFLIWFPFVRHVTALKEEALTKNKTVYAMTLAVNQLMTLQKSGMAEKKFSSGSLVSIVNESLKGSSLSKYENDLSQTDSNKAQIKFQHVSFDKVVRWLTQLWHEEHVKVINAHINASKEMGIVDVDLVLGR